MAQEMTPPAMPDGQFNAAQAEQGEQQFAQTCAACHTLAEHTGAKLKARWDGTTVADLFDVISNTMPASDPGSLTKEQYLSIIAYLLKESGYRQGSEPLSTDVAQLKRLSIRAN